MSKATPIPDSIEDRPGGIETASCIPCGGKITRVKSLGGTRGRDAPGPWWHVITGRSTCVGSGDE